MTVSVRPIASVDAVDARAWDSLVGEDDPFTEHAFLRALEQSGCVGQGTAWQPLHLVAEAQGELVGAMPLYAKSDSWGEYVFDFAWADGAARAGIAYYPKLVAMVPFTPASTQRFLVSPARSRGEVVRALLSQALGLLDQGFSSLHVLYVRPEDEAFLVDDPRFARRRTVQFHFTNPGISTFDEHLARMRSSVRKQLRKERDQVAQSGLDIRVVGGPDLTQREWDALFELYKSNVDEHGSRSYLNRGFFELIATHHAHRVVACLASRGSEVVAGSFNFEKGRRLFGRTWGARVDVPGLHFECCYHRLIEHSLRRGILTFEAGAQGHHKLKRGLLPVGVPSFHAMRHRGLHAAVAAFLHEEDAQIDAVLEQLHHEGPFRRGGE